MDINKNCVHMNRTTGELTQLITLDEDFNIGDSKKEIISRIKENGYTVIEKCVQRDGKTVVAGQLVFALLYATEGGYDSYNGKISFEENYVFYEAGDGDVLRCKAGIVDLSINIINNKKINVKAVVEIVISSSCIVHEDVISGMEMENLQTRMDTITVMQLVAAKRDILRVRESYNIPADNPNISRVVWYELDTMGIDAKTLDGAVSVKGNLAIAGMYETDNGEVFCLEKMVPFSGVIDLPECIEKLPMDIIISTNDKSLIVRQDGNGEQRIVDAEVILGLDIKVYDEKMFDIMKDAYSPNYELNMYMGNLEYDRFVMKSSLNCRLEKAYDVPWPNINSVLNCSGRMHIDEIRRTDTGIAIEGDVTADVLFLGTDNNVSFARYEMPFDENLEIAEMQDNFDISVKQGSLNILANILGNGNVSIKSNAEIIVFVVEKNSTEVITEVEAIAPDYDKIKNLPSIVGYITREGDTLWDIAKKYCTTIAQIRESNEITTDEIEPGTKLLLTKIC